MKTVAVSGGNSVAFIASTIDRHTSAPTKVGRGIYEVTAIATTIYPLALMPMALAGGTYTSNDTAVMTGLRMCPRMVSDYGNRGVASVVDLRLLSPVWGWNGMNVVICIAKEGFRRVSTYRGIDNGFERGIFCSPKTEIRDSHYTRHMSLFDYIPWDISCLIVASDEQTWRSMRLVSTYFHRLLSWQAYVDKFTVASTTPVARTWTLDGRLHREHDLPAVVNSDGTRKWCRYGRPHRDLGRPAYQNSTLGQTWSRHGLDHRAGDRPALIRGYVRGWYRRGLQHRDHDRPAFISDDIKWWYQHGALHRDHGQPAITWPDGSRMWYRHGQYSRDHDLPTTVHRVGTRSWYRYGMLHRGHDLPALINAVGDRGWYRHGVYHRGHHRPTCIGLIGVTRWG